MASLVRAYLGLGGNVGNVLDTMCKALDYLNGHVDVKVIKISKLYKTPPWGVENQAWFLNACVTIETTKSAEALLELCLNIEQQLDRVRNMRWGPRTIDIDVLDYNNMVINSKNLTLPHPRIKERAFVLVPLNDIATDFELDGKSCVRMLAELPDIGIKTEIDCQNWWPSPQNQ